MSFMSSDITPDDIDDILSGMDDFDDFSLDEDDVLSESSKKTSKKKGKKGKKGLVAAVVIAVTMSGLAVLGSRLNTETNPQAQQSNEDTSVSSSPAAPTQVLEPVNVEEVEFARNFCTTLGNWSQLKTLPAYGEPAKLSKAREDMVKVLDENIDQLTQRMNDISALPERSFESAQNVMSQASILNVYQESNGSPSVNNVTNAQTLADSYKDYIDALKSMRGDLSRPATYDENGLNNAISASIDSLGTLNSSFESSLGNVFRVDSFENIATLQAIGDIPQCDVVDTNNMSDTEKLNMENQEKIRNAFLNDRCQEFLEATQGDSSQVIADNRALCKDHIAQGYEDVSDISVENGLAPLPDEIQSVMSQSVSTVDTTAESTVSSEVESSDISTSQESTEQTSISEESDLRSSTDSPVVTTDSGSE